MHTRREIGVDEAAGIANNTEVRTGICRGAVRPVGSLFDIPHDLSIAEHIIDVRHELEIILIEGLRIQARHLLLGKNTS